MQKNSYTLQFNEIKISVDQQNWQSVDLNLPQIPHGIYTFQPNAQKKIYYQRLLYCLSYQEESKRAYKLTQYLLSINTNNYYALMLRVNCQNKIWSQVKTKEQWQNNLKKQLYFTNCLLKLNPKEYQLWNHKKDLISNKQIELFGIDIQKIIESQDQFIFDIMVNDDEKNYHAWDYKNWLVRFHGNLIKQIKNTQSMIFLNLTEGNMKCQSLWSNCYSCWSYRLNLIMDLPINQKLQYISQDIHKVLKFLQQNSNSQCAWNYLDGLISTKQLDQTIKADLLKRILDKCTKQYKENRFAWQFLLANGQKQVRKQSITHLLKIDPIRTLYYKYLQQVEQI